MILYCIYEEDLLPNYVDQFLYDAEPIFMNPHLYPLFNLCLFYINDNGETKQKQLTFVKSSKKNPDGSTIEYFANYRNKVKEFLTDGVKKPLCIMIQQTSIDD